MSPQRVSGPESTPSRAVVDWNEWDSFFTVQHPSCGGVNEDMEDINDSVVWHDGMMEFTYSIRLAS
jgi:hypothetical protein